MQFLLLAITVFVAVIAVAALKGIKTMSIDLSKLTTEVERLKAVAAPTDETAVQAVIDQAANDVAAVADRFPQPAAPSDQTGA